MKIEIQGVGKVFPNRATTHPTLSDIDLCIEKGEFICLLGPSGCGKSTLLNIIAGLERPTWGAVSFGGKPIIGAGPDRAVMFQDSALFPWLNVVENVAFPLRLKGLSKDKAQRQAREMLALVHLLRFEKSRIHELSGGMRQRVALARALVMASEVLLMDEPFAALDSQTKQILQQELQQIWLKTGKTIVFVTHSVEEAVLLADRVIVMSANPGTIKKVFPIHLVRPRDVSDVDLMKVSAEVMRCLKEEVEKVAQAEFDLGWHLEKDSHQSHPDAYMGIGL